MEAEIFVKIIWGFLGVFGTGALGLLLWGIKQLITATFDNTIQIKTLNEKMGPMLGYLSKIDRIEKEVNDAHLKILEFNNYRR